MAALIDVEPALGRIVGMRAAGVVGTRTRLSVLDLEIGQWTVGPRPSGAYAVAVIAGLLRGADTAFGPGDRLVPWAGGAPWTACTRVRLAILTRGIADALRPWPGAAARVLSVEGRPPPLPSASDTLATRLVDLVWQIARRWGELDGDAVMLPPGLDGDALARLLDEPAGRVAVVLDDLGDGIPAPGPDDRRRLRSGPANRLSVALALARARQSAASFGALSAGLTVSAVTRTPDHP